MSAVSLYRRLLGPDFDRLPAALRGFHDTTTGGSGTGVVRIVRGVGAWARAVANALRLPPPGDRVAVALQVTVRNEHELWGRRFGEYEMQTTQWLERGHLLERFGAATLAFDVTADERGMRFRSVGFTWLGIPIPRQIAIEVDADVRGFEMHWELTVVVRAPGVGVVAAYEGQITPNRQ